MKTYRYIVTGRVQGVAFRYYTVDEATRLGIRGMVRNTDDGAVEVYAQGDPENMRLFEEFLGRGPRLARVERVEKEEFSGHEDFSGFTIGY